MRFQFPHASDEVIAILEKDREREQQQLQQQRAQQLLSIQEDGWYGQPGGFQIRKHNGVETVRTGQTGRRMIRGIASTPTINGKNRSMNPVGCQIKFPIPLVCAHHELGQIGDVVLVSKEPSKITIHALLWDTRAADHAWGLIRQGEMRGLSAGSLIIRKTVVDKIDFVERWCLKEVSICRSPNNPDCRLEVLNQ